MQLLCSVSDIKLVKLQWMPAFYSSRALFSFARYIVMHEMFVLMVNVIFSCIDVEIITIQDTALLYIQNIFYYFFFYTLFSAGWKWLVETRSRPLRHVCSSSWQQQWGLERLTFLFFWFSPLTLQVDPFFSTSCRRPCCPSKRIDGLG